MRRATGTCLIGIIAAVLSLVAHGAPAPEQELEVALSLHPDNGHGRMLFDTCAACHGSDGAGAIDGTVPAIAAQPYGVIVRALLDYRADRRWDERMHHFSDEHHLGSVQEIADVAGYVSALPHTPSLGQGSGAEVALGAHLYASSCASCHGSAGEGDARYLYPRLAGQHYLFLLRTMVDASHGARPGFPAGHVQLLRGLRQADLSAVADYLSRLGS